MPARQPPVYQLTISLVGARPPIWRRVLMDYPSTFLDLHRTIQIAMGWQASHLHLFQLSNGVLIGDPAEDGDGMMDYANEAMVPLHSVLTEEGSKVRYEYDFGDGWEHEIQLEKMLPGDGAGPLPRCTRAARQCPPEDVGGLPGYEQFLVVMADPSHPDHDDIRKWAGTDRFDSEFVDLEKINERLAKKDQLFSEGPLSSGAGEGDFCGLSPDQMHELLRSPLDCPSVFGGQVDTPTAAQVLESAPVIRMLRVLFEAMGEKGIRLTPKGNLPMQQVRAMIDAAGEAAFFHRYIGSIRSEEAVPRVHLTRLLAELAGHTRKVKGRLMLKKAVQARVKKGDWLPLYQDIVSATLSQFNWAWQDYYEGLEGVQYVGPFGFWLLHRYGGQWRPVPAYLNQMLTAFPALIETAFPTPYAGPEEITANVLNIRMIALYRLLGLVELDPEQPEFQREDEQMIRRTALFESLFRE
jgi:hypothetical protein